MDKTTTLCMTFTHSDKISASDIFTGVKAALQMDGYACEITDFCISDSAVSTEPQELTDDTFTDKELECIYGIKPNRSITCEDDALDATIDYNMQYH